MPRSRTLRIALGVALVVMGIFGWLPIVGFWMIPLGLAVLSVDLHPVRRVRRRYAVWAGRRQRRRKARSREADAPASKAHNHTLPGLDDVRSAAERLEGIVTRTPLLRSIELDRATGGRIWIKPECLQRSGSFKLRGAYARLTALSTEEKARGVVAFSSGNHGQGVALAAKLLGIKATIVMPKQAPKIKIEKTRAHGPEVVFFDLETESREEIARGIAKRSGAVLVPSYDDPHVIAGQGTAALEVIEDLAAEGVQLDSYIVCAGGGGLMAGAALCFSALSPETELYTAEPAGHDDHARSFAAGSRVSNAPDAPRSVCDALMVPTPGVLTFAINRRHVTAGLAVTETEILEAVRFAAGSLKLVAEPSGAAALAAVLSGKIETRDREVGLIITGGNLDASDFADLIAPRES